MLTLNGYKIPRTSLKLGMLGELTVKPYVPSVFVNPKYVQKYKLYIEKDDDIYESYENLTPPILKIIKTKTHQMIFIIG
jgi:hypothetical protein